MCPIRQGDELWIGEEHSRPTVFYLQANTLDEGTTSKFMVQVDLSKPSDTQFSINPKKGFVECYFRVVSMHGLIDLVRALRQDLKVTTGQIIICLSLWFSNFRAHKPHLVGLLKCRFLGLISKEFGSGCLRRGPRSCILKKLLG